MSFSFLLSRRPPLSPLFPYTTLFRSRQSHRSWLQQTRGYQQYEEIKKEIDGLLERHSEAGGEFIFADIHTTSARSCAFVLLNDTLSNRQLAKQFPAPRILGIERHIRGPILRYINTLGL